MKKILDLFGWGTTVSKIKGMALFGDKRISGTYTGIYHVLDVMPIWAIAASMFVVTQLAMLVGRDFFEGLPYQVSYAAMAGDAGFVVVVLLAADILQRKTGVRLLLLLNHGTIHFAILSMGVFLSSIVSVLTLSSRSGQTMDVYHDVVIAPLFLYFALTLLPLIFKNGRRSEKIATCCFIVLWAALVVFDTAHDRMNQRRWLVHHSGVIEQMK